MEPQHDRKATTIESLDSNTPAMYEMYKPEWPKIRQKFVLKEKTEEGQREAARRFNVMIKALKDELSGPGAFFATFTAEQKYWYMDSTIYSFCSEPPFSSHCGV